ncbi:hypothetical protein FALBO_15828 [Fusarium albosuccineum]|uniref:Uncharacterized protein n=1 Tax=Fusarium albosuccineum TaxID=1237068 RepID=A0A8H4PB46_9HYPO|nr:hypothetical protein FALBO_15828 [Fusarium albosuccineum]
MDLTKPRPNDEEALATALKEVTFWVHSPHLPVCKYTVAIGLGYLKPDPEDSGPDDERATPMTRQVSFLAKACNRIQEVNNRFPTRGEVIDLFNFK